MLKLLKWPALYALYVDLTGTPAHEVDKQLNTFKSVLLKILDLGQDVVTELVRTVQSM